MSTTTSAPDSMTLSPTDPKIIEELKRFEPSWIERKQVAQISLFYLLVTILVGIPLWWKTTTPYHAPLPYAEIEELSSRAVEITIPVRIISFVDNMAQSQMDSVKSWILDHNPNMKSSASKLSITYDIRVGQATESEKQAFSRATSEARNFDEFWTLFERDKSVSRQLGQPDEQLSGTPQACAKHPSTYHFLVMPQNPKFPEQFGHSIKSQSGFNPVSFVRHSESRNLIYTFLTWTNSNLAEMLGSHVKSMLDQVLVGTDHMQHLAQRHLTSPNKLAPDFVNSVSQRLTASSEYDVTLTLLTHDGSVSKSPVRTSNSTSWTDQLLADPVPWLHTYVEPAFESWLPFVKVNFFSQRLHAVNIEQLQRRRSDPTKPITFYTQDDLSTLINHLESYLGPPQSAQSSSNRDMSGIKPGLHIVLLLATSTDHTRTSCPTPLRFRLARSTDTDLAIVPQWGGLLSIDPACSTLVDPVLVARKLITIIHSTLGLRDPTRLTFHGSSSQPVYFVQPKSGTCSRPANWELNQWFVRRIEESLTETNMTINSIINLLHKLPNMVIRDHVASQLTRACSSWSRTLDGLKLVESTCLGQLFLDAHDALASSNGAFFDHSLLGLLYFEEDQKYGIYTPLFAPFGFGLLLSTVKALRIIFKNPTK